MTWLLRLAALGCLAGCCAATRPLAVAVLAAGALVFAARSEVRRSDLCICGDIKEVHEHHRPGSDCSVCGCPDFNPPWVSTRRTS